MAAVFGAILWPLLQGRVYVRGELGWSLIARAFYRRSLEMGEAFEWWPDVDAGLYLHGLGTQGLYHPLRFATYWLLPLPWSFDFEFFVAYPAALAGGYWLLRRWALSRPAALFGGALFALSGFNLLHHVHSNVIGVAAQIPLLLVMLDIVLRDGSPRRRVAALAGVTLLTGSQLLLHFPQAFVMSAEIELGYCLVVGLSRGGLARALPLLGVAKLLGVALAAVQLLPSWEYIQYTIRADTPLAFRYTLSLPPLNLLQLVGPYLFSRRFYEQPGLAANANEYGLYDGAVALALLIWVLMRMRTVGRSRRAAWGLVALFAVGLDLSLGAHGLLYHVQVRIPIIGLFRASCRNILLVHLALAGLGALALEDLRGLRARGERVAWRKLWPLALAPAIGVGVAGATLLPSLWPGSGASSLFSGFAAVWAGPALAAVAACLVAAAARGWRWALPLLIVGALADLGAYGLSYMFDEPPVSYRAYAMPPGEPALPPPEAGYRVHGGVTDFRSKMPNILALWGYRIANAYPNVPVVRELSYIEAKPLQVAGVRWVYRNDLPQPEVMQLADPMPRVRLVSRAVVSDRAAQALRGIDVATTAVVPEPLRLQPGPAGRAELLADRPGDIRVQTQTPGRQLLIVNEKQLAGWRVTVDGEAAELVRVYGDFMGCVVTPGRHQVRFHFDPDSLRLGRRISLTALWASLGLYTVMWLRRPRGSEA